MKAKKRFLTVATYMSDEILCFTEMEHYRLMRDTRHIGNFVDTIHDLTDGDEPCDWVWQWAYDKEHAKSQHEAKVDEWELNPNKETY
jgi:hypothetical protein